MALFSLSFIFAILLFLCFLVGIFLLQVVLSKAKTPYLGLILPVLSFLISCIVGGSRLLLELHYGFVATAGNLLLFAALNIPTLVLAITHAYCRKRR